MKDFSVIKLTSDDKILLGLGNDAVLYETESSSQRLLQKIIIALKQDPGSNIYTIEGYSLKSILGKKLSPVDIEDIKIQIYYTIEKLQKSIIADQEINGEDSQEAMLEKISISDIETDEDGLEWGVSLIVFDKLGGKTFLRV